MPYNKCEQLEDGRKIYSYTISDGFGCTATILNYGAVVQSLKIPLNNTEAIDVVLGYDTAQKYVENSYYMGCVVGRVSGRIANCTAKIDGIEYTLSNNSGGIHLHGGCEGFNTRLFEVVEHRTNSIVLEYFSKDGESGYPGDLKFSVQYTLENSSLIVKYSAISTKSTFILPTQHSYFSLGGCDIYSHRLQVDADSIYELDTTFLRTGKLLPVKNTPFDLKNGAELGTVLNSRHEQLSIASGIDHSFVLNGEGMRQCATLSCEDLAMDCFTDMSVLHIYSSNFLEEHEGKVFQKYNRHSAVCLEFQDTLLDIDGELPYLNVGEEYAKTVVYKFRRI